jgi:hypothetical protein
LEVEVKIPRADDTVTAAGVEERGDGVDGEAIDAQTMAVGGGGAGEREDVGDALFGLSRHCGGVERSANAMRYEIEEEVVCREVLSTCSCCDLRMRPWEAPLDMLVGKCGGG